MSSGPPGRSPYHHARSRHSRLTSQRAADASSAAVTESDSFLDPPRTTSAAIMNMNMNLTARFDDVLDSSHSASFPGQQHQNFSNGNNSNTSLFSASGTSFLGQGPNATITSQDYNPFALPFESTYSPNSHSTNIRLGYPPVISAPNRYSIGSTTSSASGPAQQQQQQHVHFAPTTRKSFLDKGHLVSLHPSSTKSTAASFSFSNFTHNQSQPPFSLVDIHTSPSSFLQAQRYSLGSSNSTATTSIEESKERNVPKVNNTINKNLNHQTDPILTKKALHQGNEPMIIHLRNLVTSCLQTMSTPFTSATAAPFAAFSSGISSPASMTVFYASMLYTRTRSLEDAFLYAQALVSNDEKKRAIWILDKAGLLSCPTNARAMEKDSSDHESKHDRKTRVSLRIDSVLLAASCLSSVGEWEEALLLLEDVFRYPQPEQCTKIQDHTGLHEEDDQELYSWQNPSDTIIESGDDPRILLLANYISQTNDKNQIHPVARLCTLRGIAYDEMSNPTRATSFLVTALKVDPMCVQAWNYLCARHLLSPMEERELLTNTLTFDPTIEWLRDVYFARLAIPRIDCLIPGEVGTTDGFPLGQSMQRHNSLLSPMAKEHHEMDLIDESTINLQVTPSILLSSKINTSSLGPMDLDTLEARLGDDITSDVFHKIKSQHGLSLAPEVLSLAAIRAYDSYNLPAALMYCKALSDIDPLCSTAAHVHIATLTGLHHKRPLFRLAHMLVEADPKSAMAWYAVGCYYQVCGKYELAQKHFCRATRLNPRSAECWIAFGCSFAARDESDQALASFRAAQRLHCGNHYPMLYMGMEYLRTNHLSLAGHFLKSARLMGPDDPLCYHELGVLAFRLSAWHEATGWFLNAIRIYTERIAYADSETFYEGDGKSPVTTVAVLATAASLSTAEYVERCQDNFWEPTIFNLGHCYRKMQNFREALLCFEKCTALCPNKASTYSAVGFTKHLMGDIDGAVEVYHQALGIKSDDTFTMEMLNRALQESLELSETIFPRTSETVKSRHPQSTNMDSSHMTDESYADMSTD